MTNTTNATETKTSETVGLSRRDWLRREALEILTARPMILTCKDGLLPAVKQLAREGLVTIEYVPESRHYAARMRRA